MKTQHRPGRSKRRANIHKANPKRAKGRPALTCQGFACAYRNRQLKKNRHPEVRAKIDADSKLLIRRRVGWKYVKEVVIESCYCPRCMRDIRMWRR